MRSRPADHRGAVRLPRDGSRASPSRRAAGLAVPAAPLGPALGDSPLARMLAFGPSASPASCRTSRPVAADDGSRGALRPPRPSPTRSRSSGTSSSSTCSLHGQTPAGSRTDRPVLAARQRRSAAAHSADRAVRRRFGFGVLAATAGHPGDDFRLRASLVTEALVYLLAHQARSPARAPPRRTVNRVTEVRAADHWHEESDRDGSASSPPACSAAPLPGVTAGHASAANLIRTPASRPRHRRHARPAGRSPAGATTTSPSATVTDAHAGTKAMKVTLTRRVDGDRKALITESAACAPIVTPGQAVRPGLWYKSDDAQRGDHACSGTTPRRGWQYWTDLKHPGDGDDLDAKARSAPRPSRRTPTRSPGASRSTASALCAPTTTRWSRRQRRRPAGPPARRRRGLRQGHVAGAARRSSPVRAMHSVRAAQRQGAADRGLRQRRRARSPRARSRRRCTTPPPARSRASRRPPTCSAPATCSSPTAGCW